MSDYKVKMHQIRFPLRLCLRPRWGSSDHIAVFKKPTSKGKEGQKEGRGERKGRKKVNGTEKRSRGEMKRRRKRGKIREGICRTSIKLLSTNLVNSVI